MKNVTKGLLLKDLYVFKSYRKNIIFSIIVFASIIGLASLEINVIFAGTVIFLIVFGMNSISTFSYDEMAETDKYLLSLPVSRKDIVKSKYIFSFLDSLISLILGLFVSVFMTLLATKTLENFDNALLYSVLAFTSVTFLVCCNIPCIYKWGVERGRMQSMIMPIFIVIILGIMALILFFLFPNLFTKQSLDIIYKFVYPLCILGNIIMYLISYYISYYIFSRKDL